MSANVESMAYAGAVPWHGIGTYLNASEVRWEQMVIAAGLACWSIHKQPIYLAGSNKVDGIPVLGKEVKDAVAIVRGKDGVILGVATNKYEIIQNEDAFSFIDDLIGAGQAVFHTAGSLNNGRRVFCTIKFPKGSQIGPDLIDQYLLLSTGHDGKTPLHIRWTPIRVVCWNTLNVALKGFTSAHFNIVHTKNYEKKIETAREVLRLTQQYQTTMEHEYSKLLAAKFTDDEMKKLAEELFPQTGEKLAGITRNNRDKVVDLFHSGAGNDTPDVRNTRWAAYNAVTDFADHHKLIAVGKDSTELLIREARMNSAIFGSGANLKQTVYDLLKV